MRKNDIKKLRRCAGLLESALERITKVAEGDSELNASDHDFIHGLQQELRYRIGALRRWAKQEEESL